MKTLLDTYPNKYRIELLLDDYNKRALRYIVRVNCISCFSSKTLKAAQYFIASL